MVAGLEHFLSTAGYLALFALTVAQCCGFPVSSEVVLPFAGVLTANGTLELPVVILVAVAGELVGALIAYAVAAALGRAALLGYGRRFGLRESHLAAAERFYQRRGLAAVAVGRVLPIIRSYTSFPAGFAEMPLVRFLAATLLGALVWDCALVLAGRELGRHFKDVGVVLKPLEYLVAALVLAGLLYLVWRLVTRPQPGTGPGGQ